MNNQTSAEFNFTEELARLSICTAKTAIAIRLNSAYAPLSKDDPNTPYYVMELSDSLHNFDQLGRAIIEKDVAQIIQSCEHLIWDYKRFLREDNEKIKELLQENRHFNPQETIAVFQDIKVKTEQYNR